MASKLIQISIVQSIHLETWLSFPFPHPFLSPPINPTDGDTDELIVLCWDSNRFVIIRRFYLTIGSKLGGKCSSAMFLFPYSGGGDLNKRSGGQHQQQQQQQQQSVAATLPAVVPATLFHPPTQAQNKANPPPTPPTTPGVVSIKTGSISVAVLFDLNWATWRFASRQIRFWYFPTDSSPVEQLML